MWWKVSGTEYHLEDKDSFFSIITADSARKAVEIFLTEDISGNFEPDQIADFLGEFDRTGQIVDQDIWVGSDCIFSIFSVDRTLFGEDTCPHCDGTGLVRSHIPF